MNKFYLMTRQVAAIALLTSIIFAFQNCSDGFNSAMTDTTAAYDGKAGGIKGPRTPNPVVEEPIVTEPVVSPTVPKCSLSKLISFPGALGFGRYTVGGRGGRVIKVTNLNNSGPGSLRAALEDSTGRRFVVFDVEGRIRLTSEIRIRNPYITVAGQTAPGSGVVISGARIHVGASEVILRGLKTRAGDEATGDIPRNRDNISIGGNTGTAVRNIVVDHNSCTWGIDESLSLWGTAYDVTISNNLIAQSLNDSIHIDEGKTTAAPHSMGMIVGHASGDPNSKNITIARNLFTSNKYRNAMIKQTEEIEFVNNYVMNYGAGHQGLNLGGGTEILSATIIGNYYQDGLDTPNDIRPAFDLRSLNAGSKVFLGDNFIEGHLTGTDPQTKGAHGRLEMVTSSPPFLGSGLSTLERALVPAKFRLID